MIAIIGIGIIGLIFAFKLNCSEAQLFLKMAGYNELYVRDKRDLIIYKCIKEEKELKDTNQLLLQFKVAKIGNLDDDEGTID